jgi:hypothetical protein
MVSVTLLGVMDVAKMLFEVTRDIDTFTNEQLIRASAFVVSEVQQSIFGNRAEEKSVDTGAFANSIQVTPIIEGGTNVHFIRSVSVFTDIEYAPYLEYGTSKMPARAHFQNTAFRIEPDLKEGFNMMITKICDKANKK